MNNINYNAPMTIICKLFIFYNKTDFIIINIGFVGYTNLSATTLYMIVSSYTFVRTS